jgi:hypothetical protein
MKVYAGLKCLHEGNLVIVERVDVPMIGEARVRLRHLEGAWGGCRETVRESRLTPAERPIPTLAGGAA